VSTARSRYDLGRLAVDVANGDLALGVRAKLAGIAFALVAGGGEQLEDLVAVIDRGRHQFRRFVAGVAEHDALVACAFLDPWLVGRVVDALGDMRGLEVQEHIDLGGFPVEPVLLIADGS
jgi:hypothetical protein